MERDLRPSGDFDGDDSGELPSNWMQNKRWKRRILLFKDLDREIERGENLVEVSEGESGELLLDWLQEPEGDVEAVVGAVSELRREPYRPERASRFRAHVIRPRRVPTEIEGPHTPTRWWSILMQERTEREEEKRTMRTQGGAW